MNRQPTSVNLKDDAKLTVTYPFDTQREIGTFEVTAVQPSENLVQEPKIKLMLSLNRHGILDRPQATLIEYVKREDPPPEPAKEEKKGDAKESTDKAADANGTDDAATAATDKKDDAATSNENQKDEAQTGDETKTDSNAPKPMESMCHNLFDLI